MPGVDRSCLKRRFMDAGGQRRQLFVVGTRRRGRRYSPVTFENFWRGRFDRPPLLQRRGAVQRDQFGVTWSTP